MSGFAMAGDAAAGTGSAFVAMIDIRGNAQKLGVLERIYIFHSFIFACAP
jgi:hypothetical protein